MYRASSASICFPGELRPNPDPLVREHGLLRALLLRGGQRFLQQRQARLAERAEGQQARGEDIARRNQGRSERHARLQGGRQQESRGKMKKMTAIWLDFWLYCRYFLVVGA